MKKLVLFLALGFAICNTGFSQTIVKQNEQKKTDHSGMKHHDKTASKDKDNADKKKHKHKHKHKHGHHKTKDAK